MASSRTKSRPVSSKQPAKRLIRHQSGFELTTLQHELEVHQIELEMQNEALRQAQVELEASRDRYCELYDLAPVAYLTLDEGGVISEANLTAAALLGTERARLVGRRLSSFIASDQAAAFHLFLRDVFRVTQKCSTELELELGSPGERVSVHIEAIAVAASEQQPKRCRCVLVDLSTLRRTEHKLRESDERFRQIAECIEDVFYVREQDGRFSYVSPGYERLRGASSAARFDDAHGWRLAIHAEDRERFRRAEDRLLLDGEPLDQGYRLVREPNDVRYVRHRAYPIMDRAGRVVRTVGVVHDITTERKLEDELRQAQKLEAIGALASGVAHDFNNVLQAILGLATMAASEGTNTEETRRYVDGILRAARRGGAVAGRLMAFARRGAPRLLPPRTRSTAWCATPSPCSGTWSPKTSTCKSTCERTVSSSWPTLLTSSRSS